MNVSKSNVKDMSFEFAIDIVDLYKTIISFKKEYVLSKQLLRSGTSVGANIRESQNAESKLDFIHKLSIAQKEIDETIYWLELLYKTDFIDEGNFIKLNTQAISLIKIIKRIIITTKKNLVNNQ